MKRLLALSLFMLALTFALFSCKTVEIKTEIESDKSIVIDQDESLPPLAEGGKANYTVVRSDLAAGDDVKPAILVCEALEAVTGADFTITTDWEKPKPTEEELSARFEILVGDTNRHESKLVAQKLTGADDYIIEVVGRKLVIVAGSTRALQSAAEYFRAFIGYGSGGDVTQVSTLSLDERFNHKGVYEMVIAPQSPDARPCIVDTLYPTDDIVVADKIFTLDYSADNTGTEDVASLLQKALNELASAGGGTLWLPAGKYRITKSITIPAFVTLRGDWRNPEGVSDGEYGTVIIADVASSDNAVPALFTIRGSAGVNGLTVWYPEQKIDDVKPYPYTFYVDGQGDGYMLQTIMNATVLNGYRGIGACVVEENAHEMMTIDNVYGTFLYRAATAYNQADVGTWKNLFIDPVYWANATAAFNAPDYEAVKTYTSTYGEGLILGDLEWTQFANVRVKDYAIGVHIVKGKRIEFAGALYDFNIENCKTGIQVDSIDSRWGMVVARGSITGSEIAVKNDSKGIVKLAGVKHTGSLAGDGEYATDDSDLSAYNLEYNAAPVKPVARQLFVFAGDNTGTTDVSGELYDFIMAAHKQGGGIVYLPAGMYRLDAPIVVPDGMELRGVGAVPERDQGNNSAGTAILSYYGKGTADPLYDQALITLGKGSGVRNIRVLYPENKSGIADPACTFAIRSTDDNAYVVNCAVVGAYGGVDFNGSKNHFVKKLVAYCYKYAVRAANCEGGIIEGCLQNGTVAARNAMKGYDFAAWPDVNGYTQIRTTLFYFYNTKNQMLFNSFAYGVKTLVEASKCENLLVANVGSDNIGGPQTIVQSGECVLINALRYNGKSYVITEDGGKLIAYNRLTIGNKYEQNITQ